MSRTEDLKRLIKLKSRRLQKLKEQEALFGKAIDPQILIEIEDTELEIELFEKELKADPKEDFDKETTELEPEIEQWKPQQTSLSEYQKIRIIEHDKNTFIESEQILNERELSDILDRLFGDHSVWMSDVFKINRLGKYLDEVSNQYLTPALQTKASSLVDALSKLSLFTGKNFFVFPEQQTSENFRLCMYPNFNIDRGLPSEEQSKFYGKCTNELNDIIEELDKRYKDYRNAVKHNLFV